MSNLQVRRVRFDLAGDDVPFNWNPQRPAFAMQCNLIAFFAPEPADIIAACRSQG